MQLIQYLEHLKKCLIKLAGNLYIISTPIGNLEDTSSRSKRILSEVDIIAAEDTRITGKLLKHYKIKNKLICYNDVNENTKYHYILELLDNNNNVALVSDAGTPCISDPGYRIVNSAIKNNINVISVPGPCSAISALSISGLPSDKFFFEGFLPKKKGFNKRIDFLKKIDATIIIFESPKRIIKTLNKILDLMGDRVVSICKEITKMHETTFFGNISDVLSVLNKKDSIKGEFVIMIAKENYSI